MIIQTTITTIITFFQRAFNDFPSSLNLSSLKVNHEDGWQGIGVATGRFKSAGIRSSSSSDGSGSTHAASNKHIMMSRADQGGVLEAVNLMLNRCDKDFIDRDLRRTGSSILLLTAGNGVLRVPPNITRLTQQVMLLQPLPPMHSLQLTRLQRLVDLGVSLDIVSVSAPPRHAVPLFLFQSNDDIIRPVPAPTSSFARPKWLNLSFAGQLAHAPIVMRTGKAGPIAAPGIDLFANASIPSVAEAMAVLSQQQVAEGCEKLRRDSGESFVWFGCECFIIIYNGHNLQLTAVSDGGIINTTSSSGNINALPFQRDPIGSNPSLPRDSSSTSISSMRKDLSSGSIGSIDTSTDVQQQHSNADAPRMRAQTFGFGSSTQAHHPKASPSGTVGSNRKAVPGSGGVGGGSGDYDAYDASVFALGGGAYRMQRHLAPNIHRFFIHANCEPSSIRVTVWQLVQQ
jgi:hypothetical protein